MKDLNFDETLDNLFRQELPYIMIGLSKYKTTKIQLPKVFDGQYYGAHVIAYDRRTHSIHSPGYSDSVSFQHCLGFKGNIFINENGYGYSFDPLFGHKHINQDLLIQFINIIKDYIEIRNKHMNLFRGENYSLNMNGKYDFNNPFEKVLTIYKDKEVFFCQRLNEFTGRDKKKIINNSGYKNLINSLYFSFESIADEYNTLYKRVKDLASTYRLLEKL